MGASLSIKCREIFCPLAASAFGRPIDGLFCLWETWKETAEGVQRPVPFFVPFPFAVMVPRHRAL